MKNTFSLLLILSTLTSWSQDKMLTIDDAILGYHLYPKGLYNLQWLPGGESFSQLRIHDGESFIEVQEIRIPKGRIIKITLEDINGSLPDSLKLKRLPRAQWVSKSEFQFVTGKQVFIYNIDLKTSSVLPFEISNDISNPMLFPDASGYMAHVENGLAYGVKEINHSITSNIDGIVIGESVHRSEFGITDGLFPSPKHRKLAYYEMDERMVSEYPLYELSRSQNLFS